LRNILLPSSGLKCTSALRIIDIDYRKSPCMDMCVYRGSEEWPNTYTCSKALAEDMIEQNNKLLPVAIFRPSMGETFFFNFQYL
jgi:nucleoside-diphosphate-sugar epimerase